MKVLLVDDEILIREWLQFCLKDLPDLQIIGSVANGEEALSLYQKFHPEIVLTDIKMPVMDGITLLHEIRKQDQNCIIILLTAFSEFEYARAAVREGVSEYILKTEVSAESLKAIVKKASANMRGKEDVNSKEEHHKLLRNMLYKREVLSNEDIKLLQDNKYKIEQEDVFAMAFFKRELPINLHVKSPIASHPYMFEYDDVYTVLIANIKGGHTDFEQQQLLSQFAKELSDQYHCRIGSSCVHRNMKNLPNSILEAIASLSIAFYGAQQEVYRYTEHALNIQHRLEQENIKLSQFYKEFLPMSGQEQLYSLKVMLKKIGEEKFMNIQKVIAFCKEIIELLYANEMNKQDSYTKDNRINSIEKINESFCFEDIKNITLEFAQKNMYPEVNHNQNISKGVQLAIAYIHEHYHEPLSLVDIGEYVHLNPEYFSRIFKEETGQTYTAYLTYVRLSKSCEMLIHTNYKVQEIAEAVGYANVSYFSTVFKKQYDCNPYEFRRGDKKAK